ncbi:MAG: ATP-NAD kinase family protein [Zestosphaera sp.]
MRLGLIVNPVAGMGGSVGLKGTDGELLHEALRRGARPVAPLKVTRFLNALTGKGFKGVIISAGGSMGCDYLAGFEGVLRYSCLNLPSPGKTATSREDTVQVVSEFVRRGVDLIAFVGGDGTARDVLEACRAEVPVLGIPSGVKMYSGVFAASPEAAAEVVTGFSMGGVVLDYVEVADVDEARLKEDVLSVRVYGYALTPLVEDYVIPSKDFAGGSEEDKWGIAEYFVEELMRDDVLYFLGPGTTTKAVADLLGLKKTLLGVDALFNRAVVGLDLSESDVLNLMRGYEQAAIVVSIIGRQGYLFGRGNQQFSARVLREVGRQNIYVLSTASKLSSVKHLLIDVGDPELEVALSGYWRIITGYREESVKLVLPACCLDRYLRTPSGSLQSIPQS